MSSAGSDQQHEERHAGEDRQRAELAGQVGVRALLHRLGDVLHVVGALSGGEHLLAEHRRHPERAERDQGDDDDQHEVAAGERPRRRDGSRPCVPPGVQGVTTELTNARESTQTRVSRCATEARAAPRVSRRCAPCTRRRGPGAVRRAGPVSGPRARRRPSRGSTKTLARPVIRKILSSRSWLQTSCEGAVVGADLLQAADEDAETGGVEELDLAPCRRRGRRRRLPTSSVILSRSLGAV